MCDNCEKNANLVDVLSAVRRELQRIANILESDSERNNALLEEFRPFINAGKKKMLEAIAEDYLKDFAK